MTIDTTPRKTILFTDHRDIFLGDLDWVGAEGNSIPLINPPPPVVDAYPRNEWVPHGIRLVAHRAAKGEPMPEGTTIGRVIRDGGMFRTWYSQVEYPPGRDFGSYSQDPPLAVNVAYLESNDGVTWSKPRLSRIDVPGLTAVDGFTFFIDTNPAAPASERYKAVYMADIKDERRAAEAWQQFQKVHPRHRDVRMREKHMTGIFGLTSPDGASWKPIAEPLLLHKSDTDTTVYFDATLGRYVMYTRLYNNWRRSVGRAESEDFRHWSGVEEVIGARLDESLHHDVYLNARSEYPGVPGAHLMFPMFYNRFDQTSDVRLFSSTNGVLWHQVPGGPVITPGEPDAWDGEFIYVSKDLVELGSDRIGVPYHGVKYPHKYPRWPGLIQGRVAWATWPRGRLSSVQAKEDGEFRTYWIQPAGRQIRLNMKARRGGFIRVGLFEVPGRSVDDCDPMYGDHGAKTVTWRGSPDIVSPEGKPVLLHFRIRAAELFGVEFV